MCVCVCMCMYMCVYVCVCVCVLVCGRDMTHSCGCHDSFICVTWRVWRVTWQILRAEGDTVRNARNSFQVILVTWCIHIYVPWHIDMCDVTCETCDMTHSYDRGRCDTSCRPQQTGHICDITHSYVYHDSFTCVTWRVWRVTWHVLTTEKSAARIASKSIQVVDVTWLSFIYVPWLIHICAMTHSNVCHDSFKCVPWRVWNETFLRQREMRRAMQARAFKLYVPQNSHSYVCHDSSICVPWLIQICNRTHLSVPWQNQMCDMTHTWY